MKVTVLPTKRHGVAYERSELKRASTFDGELEIVDTRENNLNRVVKTAKLATTWGSTHELLGVYSISM